MDLIRKATGRTPAGERMNAPSLDDRGCSAAITPLPEDGMGAHSASADESVAPLLPAEPKGQPAANRAAALADAALLQSKRL